MNLQNSWIWLVVIVAVILVLIGLVAFTMRRRSGPAIQTRDLPPAHIEGYRVRIAELETMFVNQPREAVAGAKLLVDDMLVRVGYPVRLTDRERANDLARVDRDNSERYRDAFLKDDPSTEHLRRSLMSYLSMARDLISRHAPAGMSEPGAQATEVEQPTTARETAAGTPNPEQQPTADRAPMGQGEPIRE